MFLARVKKKVWREIDQNLKWAGNCPDFVMKLKGKRYRWKVLVTNSLFNKKMNVKYYSKKRHKK